MCFQLDVAACELGFECCNLCKEYCQNQDIILWLSRRTDLCFCCTTACSFFFELRRECAEERSYVDTVVVIVLDINKRLKARMLFGHRL